jgi:hypothetical protein
MMSLCVLSAAEVSSLFEVKGAAGPLPRRPQ